MIAIMGLGFVGLTTAVGLAEATDSQIYGFDIDKGKTQIIKRGNLPFHEAELGDYLKKHINTTFLIEDDLESIVLQSEVIFFCVGTPCDESGNANLEILKTSILDCLPYIGEFKTLVIKSTVPPSTAEKVIIPLLTENGFVVGEDIGLVSNPEFLREGTCWQDFINPDRIVVGSADERSRKAVDEVYRSFDVPLIHVSFSTAEFIKYLSNTLLATMISYSNEASMIADTIGGIDVRNAFKILHMDKRWTIDPNKPDSFGQPVNMSSYVFPGCGFGGYCLPKDTQAMSAIAKQNGTSPLILDAVLQTNKRVADHIADKIIARTKSVDTPIGILGLAFKPNSDDVRDTPPRRIIEKLLARGYTNIKAYDPLAGDEFKKHYDLNIEYASNMNNILNSCEVIALLTAWDEFRGIVVPEGKALVDGRYLNQ
jgi:UDPglucose 6-dehydrogenase